MALNDLYDKGYVINYDEGDSSLERKPVDYRPDKGDKLHVFVDGETLSMLSYRYYGDPVYWYLIADANLVENPLWVEAGTQLIIPNREKYLL